MDTKGKSKIYGGLAATFLAVVLFFHPSVLTAREGGSIISPGGYTIASREGDSQIALDGYSDVGAKEFATAFLSAKQLQAKNISTIPELALEYRSADTAATKLWFFSGANGSFALVALKGDGYVVAGYSLEGKTEPGEIHSSIRNLLNYFEGLEA